MLVATGGIAALVAAFSAFVTLAVARTVVIPPKPPVDDLYVLDVDSAAGTVTLSSTLESRTPGSYGLWFAGDRGYARIGEVLGETLDSVVRRVESVESGDLVKATRARITGWYYRDPRELGFATENVELATEFGPAPAWLVPVEGSTRWVIQVHGRAVKREETIRGIPVFREHGFTSLLISYRNDGDAPASPDGRYALGDTEWRDVDAAMRYAIDHGATDIVLMGWSMGGATVLQALTRSEHAGLVRAVALDSPVVDWIVALRYQGGLRRLPDAVSDGALATIGHPWGGRLTGQSQPIDLARLDWVSRAGDLHVPILLMHSDDDVYIPSTASRALAVERPDIVTFEAFSVAGHTRLWNYDRARWNRAISSWLESAPVAERFS